MQIWLFAKTLCLIIVLYYDFFGNLSTPAKNYTYRKNTAIINGISIVVKNYHFSPTWYQFVAISVTGIHKKSFVEGAWENTGKGSWVPQEGK